MKAQQEMVKVEKQVKKGELLVTQTMADGQTGVIMIKEVTEATTTHSAKVIARIPEAKIAVETGEMIEVNAAVTEDAKSRLVKAVKGTPKERGTIEVKSEWKTETTTEEREAGTEKPPKIEIGIGAGTETMTEIENATETGIDLKKKIGTEKEIATEIGTKKTVKEVARTGGERREKRKNLVTTMNQKESKRSTKKEAAPSTSAFLLKRIAEEIQLM